MSNDFYRAFEERYYAPQSVIKQLRQQYLPFLQPLAALHPESQTFDLGCGRGEWLEIMTEIGLKPYGVDLDDGMLRACHEKGLPAQKGDAVEYLKTLKNESQLVVTAFHVVEHITFSELRTVVSEALRVLKPGGLLIMETPNPENITVATRNFYLDPTHQKPIPPQLLSFLPEYYGFSKVKVIRLQEDKSIAGKAWTSLRDVLGGVSPDYAVVAQKAADSLLLDCTLDAFSKEYGLTLDTLTEKFDHQTIQAIERAASAETQAQQANERAAQAQAQAQQANERAASAQAQAQQSSERAASAQAQAQQSSERAAQAQAQAQQANERAASAQAQAQQSSERAASAQAQAQQSSERTAHAESVLLAMHKSRSWRITAPLRMTSRVISSFSQRTKALKPALKAKTKLLLAHASLYVNRRPKLRHAALVVLARFPTLKTRLKMAATSRSFTRTTDLAVFPPLANLTLRARQVYADLKTAIENNKRTD